MSGPTLTAVVLTRDEAGHIADCLASVAWADARLVVDSGSADRTTMMAREAGAEVVVRAWRNYADQRTAALSMVRTPWTLFVDADERATAELAREVRTRLAADDETGPAGYWVPRDNYLFGRLTRGGGWWPDYQLRLLKTARATYDTQRPVHELVVLDGTADYLEAPLVHYNYRDRAQFHRKQQAYTKYDAAALYQAGRRARPHNFILQPLREFRRRFVTLRGYRDGLHGLELATLMMYYELVKYGKLWRMQRAGADAAQDG